MRSRDRTGQFWMIRKDPNYGRREALTIFVVRSDDLLDVPIVHECLITSQKGSVILSDLREFHLWEESDTMQRIY